MKNNWCNECTMYMGNLWIYCKINVYIYNSRLPNIISMILLPTIIQQDDDIPLTTYFNTIKYGPLNFETLLVELYLKTSKPRCEVLSDWPVYEYQEPWQVSNNYQRVLTVEPRCEKWWN
jgi:hypothetical protein